MRKLQSATLVAVATLAVALTAAPSAAADPSQFKDLCKSGGYVEQGFSNQGECVSLYNELGRAVDAVVAECTDLANPSDACLASVTALGDLAARNSAHATEIIALVMGDPVIGNIIRMIGGGGLG